MKRNTVFGYLGLLFGLLMVLSFASAAQSFSISPSSDSRTTNVGNTVTGSFVITNTGTLPVNLTFVANSLTSGSTTIGVTTNTSTITNLGIGQAANVTFSYSTTGKAAGYYTGTIVSENTDNTSMTQTFNIALTLNSAGGGAITT